MIVRNKFTNQVFLVIDQKPGTKGAQNYRDKNSVMALRLRKSNDNDGCDCCHWHKQSVWLSLKYCEEISEDDAKLIRGGK